MNVTILQMPATSHWRLESYKPHMPSAINGWNSLSSNPIPTLLRMVWWWRNGTAPDFSKYLINGSLAIHKDTVIVPAGGYVVIAFQAGLDDY